MSRASFTQQHLDGVVAILRDYPGAQTEGFPATVRSLRDRLGCEDEPPDINFFPDAFRINEAECEIEIFEVEVTHAVPERKMLQLGYYWSQWDAEGEHDWPPVLIRVDRFGERHRHDLCAAYHQFLRRDRAA